jgi:hypothetical protein
MERFILDTGSKSKSMAGDVTKSKQFFAFGFVFDRIELHCGRHVWLSIRWSFARNLLGREPMVAGRKSRSNDLQKSPGIGVVRQRQFMCSSRII